MPRFNNQHFLVTGASSGIGAATAARLAEGGATVHLWARNMERLTAVASSLAGTGHTAESVDVTNEAAVSTAVKALKERGVLLSGLAHSAGAHAVRPLQIETTDRLNALMEANVGSVFRVTRLCMSAGLFVNGGSIVAVSSQAAFLGSAGASGYSACKGALEAAVKSWAAEYAKKLVRVNAVSPGVVRTPMTERFFGMLGAAHREEIERRHLLGLGEPADVAAAITFLLSADARWITGSVLRIDGGFSVG